MNSRYVRTVCGIKSCVHMYFADDKINDKFKDGNVIEAFSYLFNILYTLFAAEEFDRLKRACIMRGIPLSQEFKQSMNQAKSVDDILNVLDNHPYYCNWLNVRLLSTIAKNLHNNSAKKLIQVYEDNVYCRKISDVQRYFTICFNKETLAEVEAKINKSPKGLTVKDIFNSCKGLEEVMDIHSGVTSVTAIGPGCMKITVVIPLYCSLHAYKFASKNFFRLRQFHIQYLEFHFHNQYWDIDLPGQVLPAKVFAFNYPDVEDALSLNILKCEFI